MTTEHKLAWALRAAADDENARFTCKQHTNGDIFSVLGAPHYDWQLVKPPVVTHEYYQLITNNFYLTESDNFWNMHITLIDGWPQKEVEFR